MVFCLCRKSSSKKGTHASPNEKLVLTKPMLTGSSFQGKTCDGFYTWFLQQKHVPQIFYPGNAACIDSGFVISTNGGIWTGTGSPTDDPASIGEPAHQVEFTWLTYVSPESFWGYETDPDTGAQVLKAGLFIQGPSDKYACFFADINQGDVEDCFLSAAIQALTAYGPLKDGLLFPQEFLSQASPPGSNAVGRGNIPDSFNLTMYKPNFNSNYRSGPSDKPAYVCHQTMTSNIPVRNTHLTGNYPDLIQSDTAGEFWPCMMEKAFATVLSVKTYDNNGNLTGELHGFDAINQGGWVSSAMSVYTPGIPANFPVTTAIQSSDLFNVANTCLAQGITMALSFIDAPAGQMTTNTSHPKQAEGWYGLISDHAYTVFGVLNTGGYRICQLRSPWGGNKTWGKCIPYAWSNGGEWMGDWADCSPKWDQNPVVAAASGTAASTVDDGIFWIAFDDVVKYIASYELFVPDRSDMRAVDLRTPPFQIPNCVDVNIDVTPNLDPTTISWDVHGAVAYEVPYALNISKGSYKQAGVTTTTTACFQTGNYLVQVRPTDDAGTVDVNAFGLSLAPSTTFDSSDTTWVPFTVPGILPVTITIAPGSDFATYSWSLQTSDGADTGISVSGALNSDGSTFYPYSAYDANYVDTVQTGLFSGDYVLSASSASGTITITSGTSQIVQLPAGSTTITFSVTAPSFDASSESLSESSSDSSSSDVDLI